MGNEKKCTKCKKMKSIDDFHRTSRKFKKKTGEIHVYKYYHSKCKTCRRAEKREWYQHSRLKALCEVS